MWMTKKRRGLCLKKYKNIESITVKVGFIMGTFNFNHPQQNVWNYNSSTFQPPLSIVIHMRGPEVPGFLADLILALLLALLLDAVNSVMITSKGINNKFKIIDPDEVARNRDKILSKPNMNHGRLSRLLKFIARFFLSILLNRLAKPSFFLFEWEFLLYIYFLKI